VAAAGVADVAELEAVEAAANQQQWRSPPAPAPAPAAAAATAATAAAAAAAAAPAAPRQPGAVAGAGSKWTIDPKEQLRSTDEHRLWTYGPMATMALSYALAWSHAASDASAAGGGGGASLAAFAPVVAATASAYVLSDLGTAVYHWFVDNYGDGSTPVFGRQIAAFQVRPRVSFFLSFFLSFFWRSVLRSCFCVRSVCVFCSGRARVFSFSSRAR